ncbi:MAG TPA: sigma 54-interacting transcriptional regulator [Clostridiales bacterium]|nr:sigma 54-interacting transcriptional regulator [Clostridiales bacterium]
MEISNSLNPTGHLTVGQIMNRQFSALRKDDTLRTVIEYYHKYKISTLPVVDDQEKLIGVFPKKRLFKALLDGAAFGDPIHPYMVNNPVFISVDRTYDEYSLVLRVTKSTVDNVVVLDDDQHVVGMIGTGEYLKASLDMITKSSALMESLFRVNYEGIVIVDKDGYILRINPAAEEMFELKSCNVVGCLFGDVFPEITLPEQLQIGLRKTVCSVPVVVNQVPITEEGAQIGFSIAFLDVSNMEKIARELELVKDLQSTIDGVLSASSDGVLVSDNEGNIRYINKRACSLFGENCSDLIGRPLRLLLQTDGGAKTAKSGSVEVESCDLNNKKCIVSHVPFRRAGSEEGEQEETGIVSTIYLDNNAIAEEIARKWLYLNQQVQYYKDELAKRNCSGSRFDQIVTNNQQFKKIKKDALLIARSSSTVLLTGESGVGKDMFARGIHEASPRSQEPFVKVNCVSIPETLFESELFGYAPGSFTGALKNGKPGYFERADKGTIFLDEIGDMPMSIQAKLLQVLQEKEFVRVGGTSKQTIDVRIIAATNRDLRQAIADKSFREDLFYRLNVIEFHLPPLRDRQEDIIPLAFSFIEKYNQILGSRVDGISEAAKKVLSAYNWPGNIRELENAIERAANYVWEGEIGVENLPELIVQAEIDASGRPNVSYRNSLIDFEREMLLDILKKAKGNKSAAARMMNLSRSAFYDRLAKHNIK